MVGIAIVEFFEVAGAHIDGKHASLGIVVRNTIDAKFRFIENGVRKAVLPCQKVVGRMGDDLLRV